MMGLTTINDPNCSYCDGGSTADDRWENCKCRRGVRVEDWIKYWDKSSNDEKELLYLWACDERYEKLIYPENNNPFQSFKMRTWNASSEIDLLRDCVAQLEESGIISEEQAIPFYRLITEEEVGS